jgi:HEAT repeat protein
MLKARAFPGRAGSLAGVAAFFAAALALAAEETRSVQELIAQLSSSDIPVRREATYQLEKLGPAAKEAVPALLKVIDDPDKQVWSNALAALAAIGPDAKDAIPTLLSILKSGRDRPQRFRERGQMVVRAAYALTRIGPVAIPPLIEALGTDDPGLRAGAAKALGGMGPAAKDAVPALVENLGIQDTEVQRETVEALGSIGAEARPKVVEALQASEARQRSSAALALGAMRTAAREAAPAMMARLDAETDPAVKSDLLTALPRVGADPATLIPRLIDGIKDEREQIRHAAVNGLLTLPSAQKPVVGALVTVLQDPNPTLRERAAYVLGRLGDYAAPAVPAMIVAASQPNAPAAFQDALVQIGTPAVPALLATAEKMDPTAITPDYWVVKVLQSMGGIAAAPVARGLTHTNANVRLLAVRVLGELGRDAEDAVPALIQRLDDPDLRVRASTLSALIAANAPMKNIEPRLHTAIKDPSPVVRAAALEAIGKLGEDGRSLQPAVVSALRDRDETIQRAALKVVGPAFPDAVQPTVALLAIAPVRIAAIDALGRIGPAAKDATPALATIIGGDVKDERLHALAAAGHIGSAAKDAATPALAAACKDGDASIRAAAIAAVAQIESDPAARLVVLSMGFDDLDISVRQATAETVGKLGEKAADIAPKLVTLLAKDSDRPFAFAALQQLPMRSVPALVELLASSQREVKMLACDKLGKMGRAAKDATPQLEPLASAGDEELARAARRALRSINPR